VACPTGALLGDGTLDARRCLAYHSVENRHAVPADIGSRMQCLFGCDICTSVCPFTRSVDSGLEPVAAPSLMPQSLEALLACDDTALRCAVSQTCMRRTGPEQLRRNAVLLRRNRGKD
jgi:epoxyqueuosine reductase QueG